MNRITKKFDHLKNTGKKAMITYIMGGDLGLETTYALTLELEKAGADIIELGIPFSDPIADGPVIQRAANRALEGGTSIAGIMEAVRKIRQLSNVPLVFLVYYNSIFTYGVERFLAASAAAGIDGLIVPDLPLEERDELLGNMGAYGLHLIPLVAPTSHERIKQITANAGGFVYCISTTGVTGQRSKINTDIKEYMKEVAACTNLPRALGFGISGPEMAEDFKDYCDGIIVGSAIVHEMEKSKDKGEVIANVTHLVRAINHVL
ncbi:tryptophan synthase subunit alpha [Bacillota bacterium LX-D]|nr:tryptophan synthase subunit alpha [Bacillota bacterium LX-D]